jgi:type I restriction enzyme M protein
LAKVIHGDGLGDFATSKEFKDLLKKTDKTYPQDNKQFDVIISNPPYSVSAFKGLMDEEKAKFGFDLYNRLTDQSSEIECLFIERTKQLLKDGGVAGIILPSSILSNTGIYTQTREILLKHFEILGIAELGSNTFMATGTNTVTLFLRRRNNADAYNVEEAIKKCFVSLQDVTINGIEKPLKKYVTHVWDTISFDDYKTLLQKSPNRNIEQHEIYKEYTKKIKAKNEQELWTNILAIEQDKLLYFILAYPQKLVLIKTGEKDAEKRFLGYEFSNRRGSEGIHAIQRSKSIDECTQLYDADNFTNPHKASTYIYKAFSGEFDIELPDNLKQNVSYQNLVDMFTFDRVDFEKNISLSAKKKVKIESKWEVVRIKDLCEIGRGRVINKKEIESNSGKYPVYSSQTSNEGIFGNLNTFDFEGEYVTWTTDGIYAGSVFYRNGKFNCTNVCGTLKAKSDSVNMRYLAIVLPNYTDEYVVKVANPKLMNNVMAEIKIPLPPFDIQKKIVSEIETLEKQENQAVEELEKLRTEIESNFKKIQGKIKRLDEVCELKAGNFVKAGDINNVFSLELYPCYGGNGLRGYTQTYTNDGKFSLVGRQGALCGNVHLVSGKFHATEHALVAYPKENVDTFWLHYQLEFMNLNQYATGTSQPGLSVMNLNPIEISVPTILDQKK